MELLDTHKITKNEILNNPDYINIANEIKDLKFASFLYRTLQETGEVKQDRFDVMGRCQEKGIYSLNDLYERHGYKVVMAIRTFLSSGWRRQSRLKGRITDIICDGLNRNVYLYFLTFTFKSLEGTTDKTRRTYIQRFLKEHCIHYVANIDFGESDYHTHREHYHAVASSYLPIYDLESDYKLGFVKFKYIRLERNITGLYNKLSKYIAKLTNHANKESTKRNCYIYDRNKEFLL